ncbi:KAT8 regulatory NSL complex subunit 2 [Anopheles maculipalpis]|uniref:KAT8 regulatory NSL complex subunit 2 n=1 Tax=Anopheles maculipalpis TaxID=1496333 RepID=UPI0021599113|nr:KAT8 regulatory NSL complex subunit 2 [Anopheles maculipalpis]
MGPTYQQAGRTAHRAGPSSSSSQGFDQAQALRTQIQLEIEQKAKVCANTQYECTLPRVDSYVYCFRHILQDPNAPYKQCEYEFPNGRRCLEPSPMYDVKKDYGSNYCFEHSRQTQLKKTKSTIGKLVPVETTETLLHGLAHHVKVDKVKQHYMGSSTPLKITVHEDDDDTDVDVVTPSVDPFVDVDVTAINDTGRTVLDYASDSSDDDELMLHPTYGSSWKAHEMDNSDNESVDSQGDDPLKHAGIYTAEEVTRITKEKLYRLQTLYIEQIHRLQHVLRERRRTYLKDVRAERDVHCSIFDQVKQTPRERLLYQKLKGLNRYHRKHGVEAILQRKYLEKRAKATEGLQQKPPSLPKCSYTEGGVKCGERTLPCCKHCRKHILEDKKQVLFRACGIEKSGVVCQEPLAGLFENVTCPLHMELPAQRSFNKRKYESESEGECETSAMEVTNTAVVGGGGVEKASSSSVETLEDKKGVNMDANASSSEVDIKTPVKTENKRKIIKTEPVTPVARVRNTRSSRAAMAKLEDQETESSKPAGNQDMKQEPTVTVIEHVSATATITASQMNDPSFDLEDNVLPVNVIIRNNPKPTEAAVETAKTDDTDKGDGEKVSEEKPDEKAQETSVLPAENVAKEDSKKEESKIEEEEEEAGTIVSNEESQQSEANTVDEEVIVETAAPVEVPESGSQQEKVGDQEEPTQTPKGTTTTPTTRQRKLKDTPDRKEM